MKKSLACTVLAGLLMGSVMGGAEAADPVDIVIKADGTVTPSTYGGGEYIGVNASVSTGSQLLVDKICSIATDGLLNINPDISVYGIRVNGYTETVGIDSISSIDIAAMGTVGGIYLRSMVPSDTGINSSITFGGEDSYIKSFSANGSAWGICIDPQYHTTSIIGLGSIEVLSTGDSILSDAYGISVKKDSTDFGSKDVDICFTPSSSKATINVAASHGDSVGINLDGSGYVSVRNIDKIVVGSSLSSTYSYGIIAKSGYSTYSTAINFIGNGCIEALSKDGAVYGIYNVSGQTYVTGLRSISVHNDGQHDHYAIYNAGGVLNILNDDKTQLVSINGDVYSGQDAITQLKNVVVTGNFVGGGPLNTSYNIRFFEKVIVNGDMNISEGITISDGGDFVFGKMDNTNSIFLKSLSSFDANTKVKICGNGILTSSTGNVYTEGTTVFAGDCTIGHSNGSGTVIAESGLLYAQGNIENKFIVKNGASLVTTARSIGSDISIEEGANLYIVDRQVGDDILNNNIKGVGTTYLQQGSALTNYLTNYYHENGIDYDPPKPTVIKVNTNQTIEGTLNGSDGTIKLAGGTAYTLTVGKLAGITNLDVAVDFSGGSAVNGMMSTGAAETGAVLNVSNVNVTADIPDGTNNGVVTYATGAGVAGVTHKVNGQVGGSITASANKLYTFTQDMLNPGKLNWSVQTTSNPITFKEFIEGTYEGKPSTLSLTENMVDGANGGTADSGLASQTHSVLNINANNRNLGTNGNNFTVNVAGGKTINLNGGATGGTVYTNWYVANNGTFNMSGVTNMKGTISGSGSVKNEGTLNIGANNLQIALNNNGGVVNLSAGTLANAITGGQLNIVENVSAVADNVKGDVNSVASGKILNLTAGSLSKNVGGEGSVEIGGTVAVNSVVQTGVTVKNGGILTADLQNLQSTVTNNGQFNMAGNLTKNIAGNGVTVLQNNIQPDNVTITGTLNGNGKIIDMQEQGGTAAYKMLTVGKLAGTTLLKIDADLQDGNNDNLVVNGDSTGAVMDVVGVNITKDVVMDSSTYTMNGSFTYVEGSGVNSITYKLNGSEAADASLLGTTATNNFVYTFTKGDAGKLNYKADVAGITFIKFIQGELEGVPDTLSLTENMVDGPNGGTADSGLASQTNDKLYINLNNHDLGTEGNKFTARIAGGKQVYLNGGTEYYLNNVYTGWKVEEGATLHTSGDLSVCGDISNRGQIENSGFVHFCGNVTEGGSISNTGSLGIDAAKIHLGEINNSGEFVMNSDYIPGDYRIVGDVHHNEADRTEIHLVGTNDTVAVFSGNVYGSDDNFQLALRKAVWNLDNRVESFDPVYNLSLEKNSVVNLNSNVYLYVGEYDKTYEPLMNWDSTHYHSVIFHNLYTDGTGHINLAVDLANNVGDQIVLQGETPETLKVNLYNKDNNGGEAFVPDGEHSVTYAKAPLSSDLEIDTSLVPMYGKQSMIYTPIVEIGEGDGERLWNFVGWSQRPREDSKLNAKDELDIPDLLPEMEEKRLEEIHRYAVHKDLSELGAWVRGETGKMSADGVDFDVKVISGGYDWANKTSKGNFFMGLGVSHGTSDADMGFVGDSKNTSFSVYGSWYGRKNYDYIDFVAKYGKIDHQYNGINFDDVPCSGEYDKNMYSFFAKYGRRLPLKNGFYIEPFGSVTYGHIGDADFYDNGQGAHMHVNSILSKIVSVGAMFGRSVKGTELYCKLAYSYDFDGEIRGSVPEQNYSEKTDMGGSSYKFAVGASRNLGKQNSLHLDLEKDFGGKMKRPWNLALTFKHTW